MKFKLSDKICAALIGLFVVAVVAMAPTVTMAQNSGGGVSLVIAVVDKGKVLRDSEVAKDIRGQIDAQRKKFDKEAADFRKTMEAEQKELQRAKATDDPADWEKKIKKWQAKAMESDRAFREKAVELDKAYRQAVIKVDGVLNQVVEDVAKNWGVTLVIRKDQAMYVNSSLDMTSLVIDELNKKLKTVKVFEK